MQHSTQIDKSQLLGLLGKLERGLLAPLHHGGNSVLYTLLDGEPAQNLQHVTCYIIEFWHLANKAHCREQNTVKGGQLHRWQARTKGQAIVEANGDERANTLLVFWKSDLSFS